MLKRFAVIFASWLIFCSGCTIEENPKAEPPKQNISGNYAKKNPPPIQPHISGTNKQTKTQPKKHISGG